MSSSLLLVMPALLPWREAWRERRADGDELVATSPEEEPLSEVWSKKRKSVKEEVVEREEAAATGATGATVLKLFAMSVFELLEVSMEE